MTPETLSRLFEPFMQADRTLDRSKGGLGLGLALVKGLVELHGGEITRAQRRPRAGGGVRRASAARAAARRLGVTPPRASERLSRRRVLIIEDNVDAADSLREALSSASTRSRSPTTGPRGSPRRRESRPEVVLCDIGLPGMDGYEVARAFKADEALKGIFLVALSGYALPEDVQRATEAGFERHLAKPPDLEKLRLLLAEVPKARA